MIFALFCRTGTVSVLALAFLSCVQMRAQAPLGAPTENSAFSIPQADLIQPAELRRLLMNAEPDKPLVLQVGSRVLFEQAHIAGAEFVGAGSQPEGLEQLKRRVTALPRSTFIVLYCGCCPWGHCPNIAPALRSLRSLGFTRAKALYIPDNFGTDWANKGYPIERGR
jgi:rhodanese-related sulfurtransferase